MKKEAGQAQEVEIKMDKKVVSWVSPTTKLMSLDFSELKLLFQLTIHEALRTPCS